jgi:hypothetical protein
MPTPTTTPTAEAPIAGQSPASTSGQTARTLCPHCGSAEIRESTTRRGADLLPSNLTRKAYRCRGCRGRFHLKAAAAANVNPVQPASGRRIVRDRDPFWRRPNFKRQFSQGTVVAGSIIAFAVFLYLLARSADSF